VEPSRTFLALPLPKEVHGYLFSFAKQIKNPKDAINWVKRANIHITLSFLGDTNSELIEEHATHFENLISKYSPIELGLMDTGIFPHANDPRVLWIGAAPYNEALNSFKSELNHIVKELGYEVDYRKFQPHITLGRVKSITRKSKFIHDFLLEEVRDMNFEVKQVKWFKSVLTPLGANYEELKAFNFKTGDQ